MSQKSTEPATIQDCENYMEKEKIFIVICVIVPMVVLGYAIFAFEQPWTKAVIPPISAYFTSIITTLIMNKRKSRQEQWYKRTEISDQDIDLAIKNFAKHDLFLDGGPGLGRCYCVKDKKECVYVSLTKMDTTKPEVSLVVDDNTEPIMYGEYSIFCIRGMIFMYAVLIDGALYCFDIRDLASKVKFADPQNEIDSIIGDKRRWLQSFFKSLENSQFIFDIDNAFK